MNKIIVFLLAVCSAGACFAQSSPVKQRDFYVAGDSNIRLFVREIKPEFTKQLNKPILLLHGARVPSVASFDLQVAGGSLAADLALQGYLVYLMDARGYGKSTRPPDNKKIAVCRNDQIIKEVRSGLIRQNIFF